MRVSTRGRYGLRAMVELARHHGRGPLLMRAITENQGIPRKYLHAILTALRAEGLVRSVRGSRGGYTLARSPERITALDVVRALEGEIELVDCHERGVACPLRALCSTQALWADVSRKIQRELAAITVAELATRGMPAPAKLPRTSGAARGMLRNETGDPASRRVRKPTRSTAGAARRTAAAASQE